jgi:hypothetical protein
MDMQPFPHIHAALGPTDPLVVAVLSIEPHARMPSVFRGNIYTKFIIETGTNIQ